MSKEDVIEIEGKVLKLCQTLNSKLSCQMAM